MMYDKNTTIFVPDETIKKFCFDEQGAQPRKTDATLTKVLVYCLICQLASLKTRKLRCSLKFLADRVCASEKQVQKAINLLIEMNLIGVEEKEEYGVSSIIYKVISDNGLLQNGQNILQEDISAIKKQDERKVPKERRIKKEREDICVDSYSLLDKEDKLHSLDNQDIESDTIKQDNKEDSTADIPKNKIVYFIPPTVEQVEEYCETRKNGIIAQEFVDFYSSKGWMIGKNKMKDWKAAVRTWESKRKREIADKGEYDKNGMKLGPKIENDPLEGLF